MDGLTYSWFRGWTHRLMDSWIYRFIDWLTDSWIHGIMDGLTGSWTHELMNGTHGFMDRLTDLLTLGLMDSWIDSRTHGLTDSWIHGWTPTSNDLSRIFLNCFNHRTKAFKINISPVLFVFRVKEVGMCPQLSRLTLELRPPYEHCMGLYNTCMPVSSIETAQWYLSLLHINPV